MNGVNDPVCVLALDIDGTILTSQHRIPPAVEAAIRRVRAAGALVILASGRGPAAMRTVVRELGETELALCFAGAWIGEVGLEAGDSTARFAEHRLPRDLALAAAAAAEARGLEVGWYVDEAVYLRGRTPFFAAELAITGEEACYAALEGLPPPHKLMAACPAGEDVGRLAALIGELDGRCGATYGHVNAVELWPPGISKAHGLATFCRTLGLDLTQVAAIGDSQNDLEMIREAGIGIAMGNAIPEVKAAARWVTARHDEAGVAQAIDRLFAEGLIEPAPTGAHDSPSPLCGRGAGAKRRG